MDSPVEARKPARLLFTAPKCCIFKEVGFVESPPGTGWTTGFGVISPKIIVEVGRGGSWEAGV
jgi:hypothetical protein